MTSDIGSPNEHDLNLLAAYVDRRLGPAEREGVASHLAACGECRAVLAEMGRGLAAARRGGSRLARVPRSTWLPIAAVLVLSAATSLLLLRQPLPSPAPPTRDPAPASIAASAAPTPAAQATPMPPVSTGADASLLVKRGGGVRSVAGKSFRLVAGEWVDSSYDPLAALPVVVASGPDEREALLGRVAGLGRYAALGERVLVVYDGTVYRLSPDGR